MNAPEISFDALRAEALTALAAVDGDAALDAWRIAWLGRQEGRVTALTRSIGEQPAGEIARYVRANDPNCRQDALCMTFPA